MDKIKKYAKMMIDEILSAEKYADMAIKLEDDEEDLASDYATMAKEELSHKDILAKTMKMYITECEDEKGETLEDLRTVYEFIQEITEDMASPIISKINAL